MKTTLRTLLLFIGVLTIGASSYADAPSWADKRADKNYVYGVGMSFKNKNPKVVYKQTAERYSNDYVEDARRKALKNLAEAVSGVNISGNDISPEFEIEPTRLKGFEVYQIYENSHEYWISFRLSHDQAEKIRQEIRVEKARKNLKEGKKELKESAFDEEFKKDNE
ncbi:MAG TPA: hypothetical protein PK990_05005 [Salinivirgaceae bacterium]|nr:hypothetical protein [Salinivirgaceae bacterium]